MQKIPTKDLNWKVKDPQEGKMWLWIGVSMLIIFGFWVWSVSSRINRFVTSAPQPLAGVSQFQGRNPVEELSKAQSEGEKILSEAQNRVSEEIFKSSGDAYIQKKGLLAGESFSELKWIDIKKGEVETEVKYQHYYKTLLVAGSELKLTFNSGTGEVLREENKLLAGIKLDTNPVLSAEEAALVVKKQNPAAGEMKASALVIVRRGEVTELVWILDFLDEKTQKHTPFLVSAKTGKLIAEAELRQ